jgi:hypothetical protein
MKKTWIQKEAPIYWPSNWTFPAPPWPPGWPRSLTLETRIIASLDDMGGFLFDCQNEFGEADDTLVGECLNVRAYDGDKLIRLRPDKDGPWYDAAMLSVERLVRGHCGAVATLFFDVDRVAGDVLMVIADVYGVTPRHGTGVPVKVEKLT